MLLSELKRTFCRFATTDPGTEFIHPDRSMNQMTAAKPIVTAIMCERAGSGVFAALLDGVSCSMLA